MVRSPVPFVPPCAAGVEQPEVVRPAAAEAVALAQRERRVPVVEGGQARSAPRPSTVSSASIGVTPIQCWSCCWLFGPPTGASSIESACWDDRGHPPRALEPLVQPAREVLRPRVRRPVALGARHVGQVVEAADQVHGVVELLDTHAAALDVARALRPAVPVLVEPVDHVAQVALGEVVQVVAERVVAGPAPDQRDGARELDRLVRVEVVLALAGRRSTKRESCPNQFVPSETTSWVTTPEPSLRISDTSRRPQQVVLDLRELPDRHARERRVLAVGGEHPRVVREAGADPAGALDRPERRRELPALVDPADLQVLGDAGQVEDVLLAPVDRLREARIAGQREPAAVAPALAIGDLVRELAGGIVQRGRRAPRAPAPRPLSEPATAIHSVSEPPAGTVTA